MKSIRGASALLLALALVSSLSAFEPTPAAASPADGYTGTHYGENNLPEDCENDARVGTLTLVPLDMEGTTQDPDSFGNVCHHMRTGMNGLDSPEIDVLVMVPATGVAERDMRIMRQSVEMWEGGIHYLAEEMGLNWLADGVDFHITLQYFDPTGESQSDEFTTYPVVDPEIVVLGALNPPATFGIGTDPVGGDGVPCLPNEISNPFDIEEWENLPGFDNHHQERSGTYSEDCQESMGGNVCFAINTTLDPAPDLIEIGNYFDLVSHELGHCLSVGHVGDGAEGWWGLRPTNDIMAYNDDPPGRTKCVSTLDVEGFALRMSKHLDVDGDGALEPNVENDPAGTGGGDLLLGNDQIGQGANDFQIQHPRDHFYASGTGSPMHCPQPDLGPIPGARVDWTPQPVDAPTMTGQALAITAPTDGAESEDGQFNVTGVVKRTFTGQPTSPNASHDDPDGDGATPATDIDALGVKVTDTHVEATISVAELWPTTDATSPVSYSVIIDGRQFDSFIRYPVDTNPMTWDTQGGPDTAEGPGGGGGYMPAGTSTWDLESKTVSFKIPLSYLESDGAAATPAIESPFLVSSSANFGGLGATRPDDLAPDSGGTIGVASAFSIGAPNVPLSSSLATKTFTDKGTPPNTFIPEDTSLGLRTTQVFPAPIGSSEVFDLPLSGKSDVLLELGWTDSEETSDLDMLVSGSDGADAGEDTNGGTSGENPEVIFLKNQTSALTIDVDPFLITNDAGVPYTLTATVTPVGGGSEVTDTDGDGVPDATDECDTVDGPAPTGCPAPDGDADGFPDASDVCPAQAGAGPRGCPELVELWVGKSLIASDPVDTADGRDQFQLPVSLAEGTHEATVKWIGADGVEIDRASITLTHTVPVEEPETPPAGGGGGTPSTTGGGTTPNTGGGGSSRPTVDRPPAGTRPPGATPAPEPTDETNDEAVLTRVHGIDRVATSVAASLAAFNDRSAEVAVLARADRFADGLAGTSLAVAYGGPLLLTPGSGLDARVADELNRVLPDGSTVFVLGGPAALPTEIDARLKDMGYSVTRLAGKDRFETAALVARAQPRHETILVATGQNFADALAAGAAAAQARGTVVLTDDGALPKATADYLAEHPGAEVFAIGGPAAGAVPDAFKVVGADRFETSVQVAAMFFEAPSLVGLASGVSFPDALSGGALLGRFSGPMLLTAPDRLTPVVTDYLAQRKGSIEDLFVIGGENAVARPAVDEALRALRG